LYDVILYSFIILLVLGTVSAILFQGWPELRKDYWSGIFFEFHGLIFDIAVFGVLIAFFIRITERRREIRHQQETIDDFKKWDSDEAQFRIAGAIRRINRLGKTNIDFAGIELKDFSLRRHDITSIRGSVFYDGTWGSMGSRDRVVLERMDFSSVDCRDVVFSLLNPLSGFIDSIVFARLENCDFIDANLSNAKFTGATLEWTTHHPDELGIWHTNPGEQPSFQQTHYPAFSGADLSGTSFDSVTFKNADFREAINIDGCNFSGARGLESCLFDNDEVRNAVLAAAAEAKNVDEESPK
jgi:uncharacterized protein YjbI with pentapeptide repeats